MMAGLNHEETHEVGDDLAIDLEVTSNRPDCLGHIGIAREVSVLWDCASDDPRGTAGGRQDARGRPRARADRLPRSLLALHGPRDSRRPRRPESRLAGEAAGDDRHRGDQQRRRCLELRDDGMRPAAAHLRLCEARTARKSSSAARGPSETIEAIDHKTYRLDPDMCVIADARVPVAIGGVMGGAATEVDEQTRDVLIEAADFDPVSIRTTARRLGLHSDSSYRFERRVDPEGIDWASRRCAELILEMAGGELAAGVVDVGARPPAAGADRAAAFATEAHSRHRGRAGRRAADPRRRWGTWSREQGSRGAGSKGCRQRPRAPRSLLPAPCSSLPPSWRRDLSREIDLIEEVARIHGYDKIPEDVSVPMAASSRRREDRVVAKIRTVLTAAGFDEAMTLSAVDEASARAVQAWTQGDPLRSRTPVIRGADHLRTSLVPSLLGVRRTNESLSNPVIELFEIAKIYLPSPGLPEEWWMLGITSGRPYAEVKGVVEAIVAAVDPEARATGWKPILRERRPAAAWIPNASCRLMLDGQLLGYVGQLSAAGQKQSDLRGPAAVAELKLAPLFERADLIPQYVPLPAFPAVSRDLNLVVDEAVRWAQIAATVRRNGGPDLESLEYRDTYRDAQRLGAGKKSLLFSIGLRWPGRHAHQPAGRRRPRPHRRRLPPGARGRIAGVK